MVFLPLACCTQVLLVRWLIMGTLNPEPRALSRIEELPEPESGQEDPTKKDRSRSLEMPTSGAPASGPSLRRLKSCPGGPIGSSSRDEQDVAESSKRSALRDASRPAKPSKAGNASQPPQQSAPGGDDQSSQYSKVNSSPGSWWLDSPAAEPEPEPSCCCCTPELIKNAGQLICQTIRGFLTVMFEVFCGFT